MTEAGVQTNLCVNVFFLIPFYASSGEISTLPTSTLLL